MFKILNNFFLDDEANENNGEAEESDDEDYSDDEDLTWKVRRSSAKCIEALVIFF